MVNEHIGRLHGALLSWYEGRAQEIGRDAGHQNPWPPHRYDKFVRLKPEASQLSFSSDRGGLA